MDTEAAEFLSSGYLTPKQSELLKNRVQALLVELRPQAVSLVDAFGIPDYQMNSALGRYDGAFCFAKPFSVSAGAEPVTLPFCFSGDVYVHLVKFAQGEPLNEFKFNVDIHDDEIVHGPETKSKL